MACYYPTMTVAIDDDVDFLGILTQHMGIPDCLPYSSPANAIQALSKNNPFQRIRSRVVKEAPIAEESESAPEDHAIVFNIRSLHEEIYNGNRFHDVSVLIIDYYMDDMSGIEVCEALSHHPAKKILLTGGADKEKLAIEAFNKGIIHRFISKSDMQFPTKLKQAIHVLKEAYFRDLTTTLLPHISTISKTISQYPPYINFIQNVLAQFNAIEYYMVETTGSYLMLDANGNTCWLILKDETEMKNFEKLAYEMEAPKHLIKGISERSLMPFFLSDDDYQRRKHELLKS